MAYSLKTKVSLGNTSLQQKDQRTQGYLAFCLVSMHMIK